MFDTICHEHLEYYSLEVIKKMLKVNNLSLIEVTRNNINGGSLSLIISHKKSKYNVNSKSIDSILKEEKSLNLIRLKPIKIFSKNSKIKV